MRCSLLEPTQVGGDLHRSVTGGYIAIVCSHISLNFICRVRGGLVTFTFKNACLGAWGRLAKSKIYFLVIYPYHIVLKCIQTAGATLACGTGACALVVAAVLEGRTDRVSLNNFFHFKV